MKSLRQTGGAGRRERSFTSFTSAARTSRAESLSERLGSLLYDTILGDILSIAGREARVAVAVGPAERMRVVAATGGDAENQREAGVDLQALPGELRDSLLYGSPVETTTPDPGPGYGSGEEFVCPVMIRGRLGGLISVGRTGLAPEDKGALTSLCDELASVLESLESLEGLRGLEDTGLAGDPQRPAEYERLQALVGDLSEIVTVLEADGSVRYVSPNVQRVLGYRPEEYVSQNAFSYLHPSDVERVSQEFAGGQDNASDVAHSSEFRVRHADGSWRLMRVTSNNRLDDPQVGGIVVTSRDVTEHRQTERELKESEERFEAFAQQAAEGVYLVDLETKQILESNSAYQKLLGYTAGELRGMTLYDVVAHDRDSVDAHLRQLASGESWIGEREQRREDGSLVEVVTSASLVSYGGRLVVGVIVSDITERRRTEEALRESEERFRSLIEQAADALFVHDLDGRLVDANQQACESLGYTKDELLSLSVQDLERDLETGDLQELWERAASEGRVTIDGVHLRKDGTSFPVEVHVGLLELSGEWLILAAARDVTERRRTEEALRASEASLARAQYVARLGSWEAEMAGYGEPWTRQKVKWSDEMYRIFGYEPRRFTPSFSTLAEATHPRDRGFVRRKVSEAIARGARSVPVEHRIVRPDSEVRNVLARIELVYDDKENLTAQFGTLLDVTERRRAEERLEESESRLSEAERIAHVGSWEYDVARDSATWSEEMYRIFGYEPRGSGLTYKDFLYSVHPGDRELIKSKARQVSRNGSDSLEFRIIRPDGGERFVQSHHELVYDRDEKIFRMVGALQDITERKALEERLVYQALHDSLTGLPNRTLFQDRLEQALKKRDTRGVVLLFVDLDNFKDVNDTLGHEAGDEVLCQAGERLRGCIRAGDTIARFGGDEFVLLLENVADFDDAHGAADRIISGMRAPFTAAGQEVLLTASIGIVRSGPERDSPGELLRDADVALYQAKERRAGYEVFDETMRVKAQERLKLVADLHRAVEDEQFVLHYQPQVDLPTGEVVGVEALLRWEHPRRGTVQPMEFIPVTEETGLIQPIGNWLMGEACRQAKAWQTQGFCGGRLAVSVNISPRQFQDPNLAGEVGEILSETGLDAECLVLELTEGMVMSDVEHTADTLRALKALGVKVSIDDFGTGYSNLAYLTRFPVDELKVDKSFVDGLGEEAGNAAIVRAVIDLAGALDLRVLAEGVETAEQAGELRGLSCKRGQGYYFARPLPASEIRTLLTPRKPS